MLCIYCVCVCVCVNTTSDHKMVLVCRNFSFLLHFLIWLIRNGLVSNLFLYNIFTFLVSVVMFLSSFLSLLIFVLFLACGLAVDKYVLARVWRLGATQRGTRALGMVLCST